MLPEGVYQEVFRSGYAKRDVAVDQGIPAQVVCETVGGGELAPCFTLRTSQGAEKRGGNIVYLDLFEGLREPHGRSIYSKLRVASCEKIDF